MRQRACSAQRVPWQRPPSSAVGSCVAGGRRRVSHHTEFISICFRSHHHHTFHTRVHSRRVFSFTHHLYTVSMLGIGVLARWSAKGALRAAGSFCLGTPHTLLLLRLYLHMGVAGPLQCLVLDRIWWVYLLGPGHVCCAGNVMSSWHGCNPVGLLRVGCLDGWVHAPLCVWAFGDPGCWLCRRQQPASQSVSGGGRVCGCMAGWVQRPALA